MVGHWKIINSSTYQFNKVQTRLVFDRLGDGPAPRVPPVVGILVIFLVISTLSVYYMFSIGLVVVGVGLKLEFLAIIVDAVWFDENYCFQIADDPLEVRASLRSCIVERGKFLERYCWLELIRNVVAEVDVFSLIMTVG